MISLRRIFCILGILCFAAWLGAQEPSGARVPDAGQPEHAGQAKAADGQGAPGSEEQREPSNASEKAAEEKPFTLFGKWVIPGPAVEALKWANFLILFGLLGWLLRKPFREFLVSRTAQIRESIEAGRRAREKSIQQLHDLEAQLHGLDADVASLKQTALAAAQAERERLRKNAEAEGARILAQAEQEIEAFVKATQVELKGYVAGLAVSLAEQRVRAQLTLPRQAALVHQYAASLAAQR